MDEHCEINVLLFDGLTDHDGDNQIIPRLAKSWEYDEENLTDTFHLEEGVKWHDGEPFVNEDVKLHSKTIMDPANESENAPLDCERIESIEVIDEHTVAFHLSNVNTDFLEYMTKPVMPKHLLEGEDWQTSDFFRAPVGTGPYKFVSWDAGQTIMQWKRMKVFAGAANIDTSVFKMRQMIMQSNAAIKRRNDLTDYTKGRITFC